MSGIKATYRILHIFYYKLEKMAIIVLCTTKSQTT